MAKTISEVLLNIAEDLKGNNGQQLDLTNDSGDATVFDAKTELFIRDIILDKNKNPCALIPLGHFDDETIRDIWDLMHQCMNIVWHKGQTPSRMELTDNGDFERSSNLKFTSTLGNLSRIAVEVCVAGKLTEKFPREVADDYVEITIYYADREEAVFCCSYTPDGLQCVHVSRSFLFDYGGVTIATKSDEGMRTFIDMLMLDMSENGIFARILEKQGDSGIE